MASVRSLGSGWFGFIAPANYVARTHVRSSRGSTSTSSTSITCLRSETRWRQPSHIDGSLRLSTQVRCAAVDLDLGGAEQQSAVDELWWEEGAPVQSLEIACRDAKGDELDPWYLSELLMDVGAMSVSVDDSDLGTKDETPLLHEHVNPKAFDPTIPSPSSSGRKDMWGGSSRVVALFPREWDMAGVVNTVEEVLELASPLVFKVDDVVDKDWVKTVQEGWDPIEVGRLRIRFPWHPALPPSELGPGQVELELEGGRAFGTGEHPTTSMCCKWVEENVEGQRVLDYGSGSGILGLAALSLGATEAVGVEIDLSAIASAAVNAATNGLKMDTYYPQEVGTGEGIDLVLTKLAVSEEAVEERPEDAREPLSVADGISISCEELGKFDVTVANILAAPITRLQPVFAYFTRPGGKLALSGVLEEQADAVLAAYAANFDLTITERLGGWVLLSGVRREP
ncbi:unnamed protein product [Pylaiella littoralis]